jgi:hypothetical protein
MDMGLKIRETLVVIGNSRVEEIGHESCRRGVNMSRGVYEGQIRSIRALHCWRLIGHGSWNTTR